MKKALITGVTGQDGAYLAELLIEKGYEVHGLRRRVSMLNLDRIEHLVADPNDVSNKITLHYGDMTDTASLLRIIQQIEPDEIYNLAAQSHVHVSFDSPEYTANSDALGTLRVLEAIRILGLEKKTRFYQASTSELYGKIQEPIQTENTPFYPRSPYAAAKLYAYWITINYREAYGMYACNGILFNHESPIRGETFVTRKVTMGLARMFYGLQDCLYMGNIDSKRDWGHAKDYVRMQWMMLQQSEPEDFVIATGENYSVRQFIEAACECAGVAMAWQGVGVDEIGMVMDVDSKRYQQCLGKDARQLKAGDVLIKIDPYYYRPTEVDVLLGDASKAREKLGWQPEISFTQLVGEMMREDILLADKELHYVSPGERVVDEDYHLKPGGQRKRA